MSLFVSFEDKHLLNGYLIEFYQSFTLRYTIINQHGIEALHV